MPSEIADSDGESDFDVVDQNANRDLRYQSLDGMNECEPTPTPGVDFDQFLSPTQRLSSFPSQNAESTRQATGSTERMLEGIAVAQRVFADASSTDQAIESDLSNTKDMSDRKRRHTAIEDGFTFPPDLTTSAGPGKRRKTYGDRVKQNLKKDQILHDPSSTEPTVDGSTNPAFQTSDAHDVEDTTTHAALSTDTTSASFQRERDRPRRVISLLNQSNSYSAHSLSTSRASMGAYESINLDFRGLNQSIDAATNPFGAVTQMTQESEADNVIAPGNDAIGREIDVFERHNNRDSEFVSPMKLQNVSNTFQTGTEDLDHDSEHIPPNSSQVDLISQPDTGKIQRKKSKRSQGKSKSSVIALSDEGVLDDSSFGNQGKPPTDKAAAESFEPRAPTVEPLSQASHATSSPQAGKRKSRKSKLTDPSITPLRDSMVERPPMKEPSSELKLSDPDMIGQPKEMYKPRPSRSRSKKVVEDDIADELTTANDQATPTPANPRSETVEHEVTPLKSNKKSAKKSKVKRAKTSAAALLKKSQQMLSDGEEDVLWLDSKPSLVKLELPPELKSLKKESIADEQQDELASCTIETGSSEQTTVRRDSLVIEVPSVVPILLETEEPRPGPKKRGRPKKTVEQTGDPRSEITTVDTVEISDSTVNARPALSVKNPNSTTATSGNAGRSAFTEVSRGSKDDQENQHCGDEEEIESKSISTEQPLRPSPSPCHTKPVHSPIKPPTFNSNVSPFGIINVKYRVGLSRRTPIPSLLRKVDKSRASTPTVKPSKKKGKDKTQQLNDDDAASTRNTTAEKTIQDYEDDEGSNKLPDRDKFGNLIAWED